MNDIDEQDGPPAAEFPRARPPIDLLVGASLFLDFDGTLVEIADRPHEVAVGAALPGLLSRLRDRLDGRLALVSGRSIDQLADLLPGHGLMVSGSHGMEFAAPDGTIDRPDPPAALARVRNRFEEFAADRPGILIETKPLGIGLHYREAPELAEQAEAIAVAVARAHDLPLQRGKMVFEVRAAGGHKGDAIARLMRSAPFAGHRPVFLGDDVTDEDGFKVVASLGGDGVLIGPERSTAARHRLDGVAETLSWLEDACQVVR